MNSNGVDPTEDDCCIDANILNDIYVAVQSYDDNEALLDNRTDDANDANSTENEICNKTDDKKDIMTDYVKQFKLSDFNIKLRRAPLDEADNYVITTNNNDVTNSSNNDGIIVDSNTENSSFYDKNKSRRVMKRKLPPDSLYDSSEDDVPLMVRTTRRMSVSSVASNNNNQNKRRRRIKKKRVSSSSVDDSNNNETGKKFEDQTKKSSLTIDKDYSKINKMKDFKRTESGAAADINETTTKRKIRKVPRNIKKKRLIDYSDSSEHDDGPSAKSNESTRSSSVDKVVDGKIKVIQNGGDEMNEIVEANSTEPFATNVVEGNNTLGEQIGNETSSGNDNRKIKKTRLSSCPDKNHVSSTELKSTRLTDEIVENPVQADINIIVGRSVLSYDDDDDDNNETGIKFKDETKSSSTIDKDYSKNKKMKDFKRTESGAADINETTTKRKIRKVPRNIKENRLISYSDSSEHDGAKSNESTRSSVDKVVDGKIKVIENGGDEINEIVEANSTEPFATNVFVEGNNTLGEEIGNETSARYDSRKIKETRLSSCPDKNDVSSTELKSTRLTVEIVEKPVEGKINIIVEDNGKTGLFKANSTEPSTTTNIVEDNNAIDECAPNVVSNSSKKINVSSKKRLNAKLESDRKTTSDLAEEMMLLKLNTENTSSPSCSALLLDDTQTKRDPKEDNSYDAVDIRAKEREDKNVENIATASENIANVDGEDELIGLRNLVADADLRNENCPKFFTNCDSIQKRTNNCTFSGESSIIGFTETVSTNVTQSLHTSLSSPSAQIIDCIDHLVEYAKIENRLSDDHVKLLTKWKCVIQSRKQHEIAFDRIENVIQYVRKIPSASSSDMEGLNNIKIVIEEFLNKTQ